MIIIVQDDNSKILYTAVSEVISDTRKKKGIKYTDFCLSSDLPQSTYDDIINVKQKTTFYNIAKCVKALGMNFEEFGKLLDEKLPKNFFD